jgi:phage recombination protein Bet
MQELVKFDESQIKTIKTTICKDLDNNEFHLFLMQCKRTGLDPFSKQIYALKLGGKLTMMTSIDGLRIIAERSGQYAGQTLTEWCGADGKWVDVWLSEAPPVACRVGVLRKDFLQPVYAVAKFSSYFQNTPIWKKMPELMLAKCAESLALRKAFPNDLSGLYSREEMEQGMNDAEFSIVESPKAEVKVEAKVEARDWKPELEPKLTEALYKLEGFTTDEAGELLDAILGLGEKGVLKAIDQLDMPIVFWDLKFKDFVNKNLGRDIEAEIAEMEAQQQ